MRIIWKVLLIAMLVAIVLALIVAILATVTLDMGRYFEGRNVGLWAGANEAGGKMMTRRSIALALLLGLLTTGGCGQMYWTRSGSTSTGQVSATFSSYDQFAADHRDCLATAGTPVQGRPGYVVITEQNFRVCMAAKNWSREQWTEYDKPAGRFRGIEDFPSRPISVDAIPEQPAPYEDRRSPPR